MVQGCTARCWAWGRIEHYGIMLYGMVFGIEQYRALWYKVVWHGFGYRAG